MRNYEKRIFITHLRCPLAPRRRAWLLEIQIMPVCRIYEGVIFDGEFRRGWLRVPVVVVIGIID